MERKLSKSCEELKRFSDMSRKEQERNTMFEVSSHINELIKEYSYVRGLCDTEPVKKYEIKSMEAPVWILPSLSYVAQFYLDSEATEVSVALFTVRAAKDWPIKYDEEVRQDIWLKAFQSTVHAIAEYEEEAFFRTLIPACTTHFGVNDSWSKTGVDPIYAPIAKPNPSAKYCSVELIHRMARVMRTRGQKLDTVMVSSEDVADLREYSEELPLKAKEISFAPCGTLNFLLGDENYQIKIVQSNALGVKGKFNIHDRSAEYGPFVGDPTTNRYNDYEITNGNVLDVNANLVKKGETQIYGFSEEVKTFFKMPITQPYVGYWDPELSKRGRSGYYGWEKLGAACFNNKCVVMGIIDRSE